MFRYRLPPTNEPDLIIQIEADHAEALLQASSAAHRVMSLMGQGQTALAVIRTRQHYRVGRMEFSNTTVADPVPIDEFGSKLLLSDQRANILILRNQLNGHVRIAINNAIAAVSAKTIHLIFQRGGPFFIISPDTPSGPFQIATIRAQGALSMEDEQFCVALNKASRSAYREVWEYLSKKVQEQICEHRGNPTDVLGEADQDYDEAFIPPQRKFSDEEDAIDQYDEHLEDNEDNQITKNEESQRQNPLKNAFMPAKPVGDGTVPDFDLNDHSSIPF